MGVFPKLISEIMMTTFSLNEIIDYNFFSNNKLKLTELRSFQNQMEYTSYEILNGINIKTNISNLLHRSVMDRLGCGIGIGFYGPYLVGRIPRL